MLYAQESYVNATKGYRFGDSEVYETHCESKGELYRAMQSEFGRCTGKMYVDIGGVTKHIGWVFEQRRKYDDCNETYLQETWVSVHTAPPTRTTEYHYA